MVDTASGGALVNKTPAAARELIANMAANSQQFRTRSNSSAVYHVQASSSEPNFPALRSADQKILTKELDELASLVRQLVMSQTVQVSTVSPQPRACGICYDVSHPTNACPTLQVHNSNDHTVVVAGAFQRRPQQQYNPYSNTYNPGLRDHPNLRWGQNHSQNQNQNFHNSSNNFTFHSRQNWQQNSSYRPPFQHQKESFM